MLIVYRYVPIYLFTHLQNDSETLDNTTITDNMNSEYPKRRNLVACFGELYIQLLNDNSVLRLERGFKCT